MALKRLTADRNWLKKLDPVDRAEEYMDDVLSNRIVHCLETRQAVERQENDILAIDFAYEFDEERANKVVEFTERMPHTKGAQYVRAGNLVMELWQCFILCTVFGWIDEYELRRFRSSYIEVARKNGKSTFTAPVGLYGLVADGEYGADIYSAATDIKQAKIIYGVARMMSRNNPGFLDAFDLKIYGGETNTGAICKLDDGGSFRPLSRDTQGNNDGYNIHMGLIDELHGHKKRDMYDILDTGTGSREQPLIWMITTAGVNRAGICYEQRNYLKRILRKEVRDESYFGIIYTLDKDDDWTDPANWPKANPNYGICVNVEDFKSKAIKAQHSSSSQNAFKTKRLNIWCNAAVAWMNMEKYKACAVKNSEKKFGWDRFEGEDTWIAIDLASRVDIASVAYIWREGEIYYQKSRHYLPDETVIEAHNAFYDGWKIDEYLTVTPGVKTDYRYIREQLKKDAAKYNIIALGYDPTQATQLISELEDEDIPCIEMATTTRNFSEPMKEWEAKVLAKEYRHDDHPVMEWMVSNTLAKFNHKDDIMPTKESREKKIDGSVATIMAIELAMNVESIDMFY